MNWRATIAAAALALAFPAGAAVATAVAARAPVSLRGAFAQPLPVVDAWGAYGGDCFAVIAATIAFATVALAVLIRTAPSAGYRRAGAFVTLVAAVATAGCAAWPFVFSSDTYAYAAYGELAARGLDPFVVPAAALRGPAVDAARVQWHGPFPACVYGPAFVALARGAWTATGGDAAATIRLLRALAILAFLASIPLVAAALSGVAPRRRFALTCAYGLNPIALWSAAEGHNDTFVLAIAAAAAVAVRSGSAFAGGAALGLSALVKAPGAVLAAAFGAQASLVLRLPRVAAGAACGLAVAVPFVAPPLLAAAGRAGAHGHYAPAASLQALTGPVPALALAAAAAVFGAVRSIRDRERDGVAWLGLAIVAALPNPYPWYGLWLAPLALAAAPSPAAAALYGATIFSCLRYLPDAAGNMTDGATRVAAIGTLVPLAFVFAQFLRHIRQAVRQKAAAP